MRIYFQSEWDIESPFTSFVCYDQLTRICFGFFPDPPDVELSVYLSLEKMLTFASVISTVRQRSTFYIFICSSHKFTSCRGCICPLVRRWLRIVWWLTTSLPACVPRLTKKTDLYFHKISQQMWLPNISEQRNIKWEFYSFLTVKSDN